jgi:hypothetical protein
LEPHHSWTAGIASPITNSREKWCRQYSRENCAGSTAKKHVQAVHTAQYSGAYTREKYIGSTAGKNCAAAYYKAAQDAPHMRKNVTS